MDKSWMTLIRDRLSLRYRAGVDAFIEFAKVNAGGRSTIRCPCNKCMNLDWLEFGIVQDHLVRYGIMVSYKIWLHHGELPDNQHGDSGDDRDESDDDSKDEYPELMEDHYRGTYMEDDDVEMDHDVRNFEKLLEASQRGMYPGCKYENNLVIQDSIKKKCQSIYRNWKHELHAYYLGLIEKGVPDPKNHPPKRVDPNDWVSMIDVWQTEEWKTRSDKEKVSRSKLPYNHISGSRSFAAAMSLIKSKNDGQAPSFPEFYKETLYQKTRKIWVNEKAQDTYERLVNKTIEQSQPEVTSPMNEFEISIEVLGRRPGCLKGYRIHRRGNSSISSIAKSAERDAEVTALKETIAMQAEQITSQAEQIASQAEQMNAQAQKTADLEALVHQLFAHSQPAASGGSRDFSSR